MRESGILMPVSSLPGPYGIGCFGKEAFKFVDFLAQAGQKIWQILPLSPTGYGDSPYQSCSAFAGNPYFIDLDALKEEGLLTAAQLKAEKWGTDPKEVDYGTLYVSRFKVLRTAYAAWRKQCAGLHGCSYYFPDDYYAFTLANEEWLDDYALYMALKVANGMKNWVEWDKPYRLRDKKALAAFAAENEEEIGFWKFVQYKFAAQWQAVKAYANKKDVQILGDIPIYVSADSVDAWVGGALFELDADGGFARVAGCPPDYFSADGQLWGNPLYNWAYHKKTGYAWWVRRVRHALGIYDLLRIDHSVSTAATRNSPIPAHSTQIFGRHSIHTSAAIWAVVFTLPIHDTATLLRLPSSAIHSRSAEMMISRAIIVAAGNVTHQV